jgi:hypothetical protein
MTWTPRPSNRSWLSTGAIVSMTLVHMVLGGGEIRVGRVAGDAEGGLAGVMRLVPRASSALEGTQP